MSLALLMLNSAKRFSLQFFNRLMRGNYHDNAYRPPYRHPAQITVH